jgi:molybdopterin/thiamine biosynthesis adenylyltransferase
LATEDRLERYSRQMLLPQIGRPGQERLAAARVGLVGCGALGSVVAMHLVRAGVGLLRVADGDHAELHNLHRQMLYTEEDVARKVPKAEAAARYLGLVNSDVVVEPVVERLEAADLPEFAAGLDLLVDGTDNFPTRFAINEYAVKRGVPWVYGGVIGTSGMSMTIVPGDGPCLRCLVHGVPSPEQSPTANVAGVMNTVVAMIASVEATEAIKLVVDADARNRDLLLLDVWDLSFEKLSVPRDLECLCCAEVGGARRP